MSGIIFSACSTSWVFRCSLAAISVQFSTLKPCRRGKCKKKAWRRRTWCCEIEMNDVFIVEDCRSVSNSTGFECISQPGWRSKHSVRIQTVLVRGDPLREVLNENTAWSSQLRHSDANTNTSTRRDVAEPTKKPIGTQKSHHNFEISREQYWPSWESLFKCTMENWVVHKETIMPDIDVNAMLWGIFCVSDYESGRTPWTRLPRESAHNKEYGRRQCQAIVGYFTEIDLGSKKEYLQSNGIHFNGRKRLCYTTEPSSCRTQKVHVYSDSVLCLGKKKHEHPQSIEACSLEYRELVGIDGEPVEFEWTIFPGPSSQQSLQENQTTMEDRIHPEQFEDRTIFTSMCSDLDWTRDGDKEMCVRTV